MSDLRDRIAEAIFNAWNSGAHSVMRTLGNAGIWGEQADALANAVLTVVQPELDALNESDLARSAKVRQLRGERDRALQALATLSRLIVWEGSDHLIEKQKEAYNTARQVLADLGPEERT